MPIGNQDLRTFVLQMSGFFRQVFIIVMKKSGLVLKKLKSKRSFTLSQCASLGLDINIHFLA
jgi:hypothetical protein